MSGDKYLGLTGSLLAPTRPGQEGSAEMGSRTPSGRVRLHKAGSAPHSPHLGMVVSSLTSSDRRRLTSWAWLMSFSFRFSTYGHKATVMVSLVPHLQPHPGLISQPLPPISPPCVQASGYAWDSR